MCTSDIEHLQTQMEVIYYLISYFYTSDLSKAATTLICVTSEYFLRIRTAFLYS